jgi:hypothetical protein
MSRDEYMFRTPSIKEREASPARMRAEAIAMRRIVVEMGAWLSPLLRNHPLPMLTEWERTVDLAKLDHNHASREARLRASTGEQRKGGATGSQATRPSAYRLETYAELQARRMDENRKRNEKRRKAVHGSGVQTVEDLNEIERKRSALKRERVKLQASLDKSEQQREAIERIAAVAAQKAAADAARNMTPEQRVARRKDVTRKAAQTYADKIKADPAKHAAMLAHRRETTREREALRNAERKAARAAARATGAQSRMQNPHRDPTIPTAKQLREEAIRAEAIEATMAIEKAARRRTKSST